MARSVQLLLWNVIEPLAAKLGLAPSRHKAPNREIVAAPNGMAKQAERRRRKPAARASRASSRSSARSMEARYEQVAQEMLGRYQVRVRKWRTSMSGIAWYVEYRNGTRVNLIETPRPKGPMSMAVFLHEIGHHAIGFDVYKPRCLEEFHAWEFAIRTMREHSLNVTESVLRRRRRSLEYAVAKACRRGIKSLPAELVEFIPSRYRHQFARAG